MGLHRAGFEVVGFDIKPQPRYPFEFHQRDVMTMTPEELREFDAVWASPPCQGFTSLKSMWNSKDHPDLLTPCREQILATGLPYIIENVPGAPMRHAIILCGSMFRLGCADAELRRHRLFETSFPIMSPYSCAHGWKRETISVLSHGGDGGTRRYRGSVAVYGHAGGTSTRTIGVYGGHGRDQRRVQNTQGFSTEERKEAMGIDWMVGDELSQAIPPAYSEHLGEQLIKVLEAKP